MIQQKEAMERIYRSLNMAYSDEFSKLLIQALKSGDFQAATTPPDSLDYNGKKLELKHRFVMTYIPYREKCRLQAQLKAKDEIIREAVHALQVAGDPLCFIDDNYEEIKEILKGGGE